MRVLNLKPFDETSFMAMFAYDEDWIEYLKGFPRDERRFDRDTKAWIVVYDRLIEVVEAAQGHFDSVGYSLLDDDSRRDLDMLLGRMRGAPDPDYAILHLLPSAPAGVVKAAYRALAMIHHPDRGGSSALMLKVNGAYDRICARGGS